MDGKELLCQRQFRTMKDGTSNQGSLMMAFMTLVYRALFSLAASSVAAFRCGPTQFIQHLSALFFASVFFKKLGQSKALLKLSLIFWHDGNPSLSSRFHYAGTTGSIAEPHG
jgi:hypothetical protein